MPVYKVEKYLNNCIKSLLDQEYKDYRIILVDDGTSDSSAEMCDEHLLNSDAEIITVHQENKGLSGARNTGLDLLKVLNDSDWVCFVDSDDTVSKKYLSTLIYEQEKSGADLVISDFSTLDINGNVIKKSSDFPCRVITDKKELFLLLYPTWRMVVAWNKLYHISIFNDLRFKQGKNHEDAWIIHRVLFKAKKVSLIKDKLYYYYKRDDSITGTESVSSKLDALEAEIDQYFFCKKNKLPDNPWSAGNMSYNNMREISKLVKEDTKERFHGIMRNYRKMFFDKNKKIKNYVQYFFTWKLKRK